MYYINFGTFIWYFITEIVCVQMYYVNFDTCIWYLFTLAYIVGNFWMCWSGAYPRGVGMLEHHNYGAVFCFKRKFTTLMIKVNVIFNVYNHTVNFFTYATFIWLPSFITLRKHYTKFLSDPLINFQHPLHKILHMCLVLTSVVLKE